jgi:drug/metabolite transporter (DMT)-like permease
MFLLIASIPMMMGHTVFNYLLGRHHAVTIAASTLGEPVGAALLAVPILGEVPTGTVTLGAGVALPLQAIGIAATLLGLFVVIREEIKASR